MTDNRDKIEILKNLWNDGFIKKEDYENKLLEITSEINESDRSSITERSLEVNCNLETANNKINFFDHLLLQKDGVLQLLIK